MIEVEVKGYANGSVMKAVKEKFNLMRREMHEDTYYQHPCRDFAETDEALRIRVKRFNGHFEAFLTYKGPKIDERSKTRREIEVTIEDPDKYEELLKALGFREVTTVRKVREKYFVRKGVVVALDEVEELGTFIEAETLVEEGQDVEGAVKELVELLKSLGVKRFERRSYLELLLGR
ncbi:class IV adenylate cyclase [Palaeococcus ferrophilus]|uniref:class IV adenylate cyclase n=1 Tax=Palaeococcus ferrophilus TaxID=83868 RepID=UPI00064FCF54|nr:class IV adenylate cyclase [Palaeococcus ferrophilus]